MKGTLTRNDEGIWMVKWSDLHSFAHGTHWMYTELSKDSNSIKFIKDNEVRYRELTVGIEVEFEIITTSGYDFLENLALSNFAKLIFPEVEEFEKQQFINKYKIIIPKEEPKQFTTEMLVDLKQGLDNAIQKSNPLFPNFDYLNKIKNKETLEEAAERLYPVCIKPILDKYDDGVTNVISEEDVNEDCRESFIEGAKWQQEKSYSEEDIENIWNEFVKELPPINNGASSDFLVYLKQFKKK